MDVSEAAKELIRKLLVVDQRERLTAKAVLAHPWISHQEIARAGSFRLERHGGIERLAQARQAARRQGSPLKMASRGWSQGTDGDRSPALVRHVSFANETWAPGGSKQLAEKADE